MITERGQARWMISSFLITLVFDAVVVWVVLWALSEKADLISIGIGWLILQATRLALWALDLLRSWTTMALGGSRQTEAVFLASLESNALPPPHAMESSVSYYLDRVASDEDQPAEVRVAAGTLSGAKFAAGQHLGIIRSAMVDTAQEKALAAYRDRFRATPMQHGLK